MCRLGLDGGGGVCGRGCRRCRRGRVAGGAGRGGGSEGGGGEGMRFSLIGAPPTTRHGHRGRNGCAHPPVCFLGVDECLAGETTG